MVTPAGLVIALVLAAPALYEAAQGSLSLTSAVLRLLGALVLVMVGTAILRKLVSTGRRPVATDGDTESAEGPRRRREDA
jgi:hypothetical protein